MGGTMSRLIVDVQLNQGSAPWPQLRDAGIAAEEAGFGTLWNLDHFSGAAFGSDSMIECFTSLTAWASVTATVGLGTLVTNVMNREPGLLANIVSSIQQISGNRLILGIGAGAAPNSAFSAEQDALGISLLPKMTDRHNRLVEVVDTMRSIWANDRDDRFVGFPRPVKQPPIIVGVNSMALAIRAGQTTDGVNTRFNHPERAALLAAARDASGNRSDFDTSVWSWFEAEYADADHPFHKELVAEGVTRLIMFERGAPDVAAIAATAKYLR
jgi:alkanesulfonate monooxygenase SsuD/methylene tetrahydromethanopterin reductase-like flavin-dependent oxidoreductase (luciferase family)